MISLWRKTAQLPKFPKIKGDIKTDVLIIGGGIAGILTAFFLQQKGIDYILVEKNRICDGTTGDTTAKITYQHGLIYDKLLNSLGTEEAALYFQANQDAFEMYEKLCKKIDCNFEYKDNFVYSTDDRAKIEKEMDSLLKIGYTADFCSEISLPIEIAGAVKFSNQAQFHPLRFIAEIAKELNIFEESKVIEMVDNTAVTDTAKIFSKTVIVTTHFPFINKHGSYFLKLYQHRSYVIALENAPQIDGMYVDENKKGYSFRNYDDLLIFGGGGHRTGKKGGCWQELRNKAAVIFPEAKEKYYWAAQDCMSLDDIPYIGNYSNGKTDFLVASGFNKWGMTGSMLSAMLLCEKIEGKQNDYEKIFNPSRSILRPQLFLNAVETTVNMLSFSAKRCPHLGCALKYNSAEHSWDCPCHGSRFSDEGKLLDNPANADLK